MSKPVQRDGEGTMTRPQDFTPEEFLANLKRGEIIRPFVVRGLAKADEEDDGHLMFAPGHRCENWIRIPVASIETVEVLTVVPCRDHTHPLVSLVLKQPETEEGRLFSALANAMPASAPAGRTKIVRGPRSFRRRDTNAPRDESPAAARSDFPWCDSLPEYEVDADGMVYCMDWCWESEHQAVYSQC
jgi:hypothetical protein